MLDEQGHLSAATGSPFSGFFKKPAVSAIFFPAYARTRLWAESRTLFLLCERFLRSSRLSPPYAPAGPQLFKKSFESLYRPVVYTLPLSPMSPSRCLVGTTASVRTLKSMSPLPSRTTMQAGNCNTVSCIVSRKFYKGLFCWVNPLPDMIGCPAAYWANSIFLNLPVSLHPPPCIDSPPDLLTKCVIDDPIPWVVLPSPSCSTGQ